MRTRLWGILLVLLLAIGAAVYAWWWPIRHEQTLADASLAELRQITAQRPTDARAFYYLGLQLERARQKKPAYEALAHAAELDKDDEQIWIAAAGTANGDIGPHAAFQLMDDFLKRHPNSPNMKAERESLLTSLQRAGDGFAEHKHFAEAIRYYRLWLDETPDSSRAQQGLAQAVKAEEADKNAPDHQHNAATNNRQGQTHLNRPIAIRHTSTRP
jgi:tetratricopeptide (TPR) repeat protein